MNGAFGKRFASFQEFLFLGGIRPSIIREWASLAHNRLLNWGYASAHKKLESKAAGCRPHCLSRSFLRAPFNSNLEARLGVVA